MRIHYMRRYTLIAPIVTNDGANSGYPAAIRAALLEARIDGWTEHETHGYWRGKREPGVMFEILRNAESRGHGAVFAHRLGRLARRAMPDQEAIQITVEPQTTNVYEA